MLELRFEAKENVAHPWPSHYVLFLGVLVVSCEAVPALALVARWCDWSTFQSRVDDQHSGQHACGAWCELALAVRSLIAVACVVLADNSGAELTSTQTVCACVCVCVCVCV